MTESPSPATVTPMTGGTATSSGSSVPSPQPPAQPQATAPAAAAVVDDVITLAKGVKDLLDYHFSKMGVNPTVGEFAGLQAAIVHMLKTGTQHPEIVAAADRLKQAAEDLANAGKPRA